MVESPKLVKPEVGADERIEDAGLMDPVDPVESLEDIAKDQTFFFVTFVYI